jgi:hypothetical protein
MSAGITATPGLLDDRGMDLSGKKKKKKKMAFTIGAHILYT